LRLGFDVTKLKQVIVSLCPLVCDCLLCLGVAVEWIDGLRVVLQHRCDAGDLHACVTNCHCGFLDKTPPVLAVEWVKTNRTTRCCQWVGGFALRCTALHCAALLCTALRCNA